MKTMLSLEEAAQLFLAIAGLYFQSIHIAWWLWPVLFLSPDISMLGYLISPRIGAWLYNIAHHKAIAVVCIAIGWRLSLAPLLLTGLLLFAHSSFDRMMGYGLKYEDSFEHTHLGMIGKAKKQAKS